MLLAGRLTPVGAFLERLAAHLAGYQVSAIGCDQVRRSELLQHLSALELPWRPVWRGAGTRAVEHASGDIRPFQLATDGGRLRIARNILLANAIAESHIVRDALGHATGIRKARQRARIDSLQAAVIALGLGARPIPVGGAVAGQVY